MSAQISINSFTPLRRSFAGTEYSVVLNDINDSTSLYIFRVMYFTYKIPLQFENHAIKRCSVLL